ncbi:MAG: DNA ligase [Gammaproteobacteria bacterium]|nr:DNA ligase [Gammaproteobacteria bacterium]
MAHRSLVRLALSLLLLAALRGHAATPVGTAAPLGDAQWHDPDTPARSPALRADPPALALAEVYSPGIDLADYLVSEKLDGVRAYWDGRRLVTRGGLVIQAPAWFTAGFPDVALDGELWRGRGLFATLSGTVRRLEPDQDAWRGVRYMLFDLPGHPGDFATRLGVLRDLVAAAPSPFIALVEQAEIADHDALMAELERVVAVGGEGLMLHRRDAVYRSGRTADLLKVKPYQDAEGRVIGHLPGRGRHAGRLGALLVEEPDGTRFRLGTGFTDAERETPPPIGTRVTFKYQGRTAKGLPRFASFLRPAETL